MQSGARRLKDREAILASISPRYQPWLHVALTVGSGLVVFVIGAIAIEALDPLELSVVPAMFVVANLVEWAAHKHLLHHRVPGLTFVYEQHTPLHHSTYRYDTFTMRSWRELRLVLIPPFGVALITIAATPAALLAYWALSANAAWLVVVTAALYVVGYETMHLVYHLHDTHPIARLPLVRRLREHHRRHHHPRVMQRWNFNVVFPIGDWLFRTWISDARFEELRARDEGRAA